MSFKELNSHRNVGRSAKYVGWTFVNTHVTLLHKWHEKYYKGEKYAAFFYDNENKLIAVRLTNTPSSNTFKITKKYRKKESHSITYGLSSNVVPKKAFAFGYPYSKPVTPTYDAEQDLWIFTEKDPAKAELSED